MKFKKNEFKKIAAGASFLEERLRGETNFIACAQSEKRFTQWCKKAGGSGGDTAFTARLKAEGVEPKKALEICGEAVWDSSCPLPEWTRELESILKVFPFDEDSCRENLLFDLDEYQKELNKSDKLVVFEVGHNTSALLPFIQFGEAQLVSKLESRRDIFSTAALSQMSALLVSGLNNMVYKILDERRRIYILRQESFGFLQQMKEEDQRRYMELYKDELLGGGWQEIFLEYSVLPRLLVIAIRNWVDFMADFALHLQQDKTLIEKKFGKSCSGKIKQITANISDAHNRGKGVIIVTFADDAKLVYKPRNLAIDIAYEQFTTLLQDAGFPAPLTAPVALNRNDHGWIEFIEHKPIKDQAQAADFYRRNGALLCLVYALGGNDFHGENIIACGEQPVLVDLETIIAYKMFQFHENQEHLDEMQSFVDLLQESVLGLGFLPVWLSGGRDHRVDFGALTGQIKTCMPKFEDKHIDVFAYQKELSIGFEQAYNFIIANRELFLRTVNLFRNVNLRVLFRPTNVYAKMLHRTLDSRYLKDGFLYSIEIERFAPAYLIRIEAEQTKKLWPLLMYERAALERRDIPLFSGKANQRNVAGCDDIVLHADFFQDSVIERICKKVTHFNQQDKDRQLEFIDETLSLYSKTIHNEGEIDQSSLPTTQETGPERSELLENAHSIYAKLMRDAIPIGEGFSWVSYQHDLVHHTTHIGQSTPTLYDGTMGIALFFAALYRLSDDAEIKKSVKQTTTQLLQPFCESLNHEQYQLPVYRMNPGLGRGLGGILKAMLLIGDYLDDSTLHHDALMLIEKITVQQIAEEKRLDLFSGLAGLIPALLHAYEHCNHQPSLELAQLCAKRICQQFDSLTNPTFSDGKSGVLFALAKLDRLHAENSPEQMTTLLADVKDCYPHSQTEANLDSGICQGLSGAGLLSLEITQHRNSDLVVAAEHRVDNIITQLLHQPLKGDNLCCGNSGRLDFLLHSAMHLQRPDLFDEAKTLAVQMIRRQTAAGNYAISGIRAQHIANPSLFMGLSGVGYALLRVAEPQTIKSIWD